jgi:hypothetical protein
LRFYIEAWDDDVSPASSIQDNNGSYFPVTVSSATPGPATLISPEGVISDTTPTYSWQEVPGATWYKLYVQHRISGAVYVAKWYPGVDWCAAGVCSVTPTETLDSGPYVWWVQTWNQAGYGPWSTSLYFTTGVCETPSAPTLLSPSGTDVGATPAFRWEATPAATWYLLWVNGPLGNVYQGWVKAADVCTGSTCEVVPGVVLSNGPYIWWLLPWNPCGMGPWSAGLEFTVGPSDPPGPITLVSPSGTISDTTPTYVWNFVEIATWYRLWVNGPTGEVLDEWYRPMDVCDGGTGLCQVTPDTALAEGAYSWWLHGWNSYGAGPWSHKSFTVSSGMSAATMGEHHIYLPLVSQSGGADRPVLVPDPGTPRDSSAWAEPPPGDPGSPEEEPGVPDVFDAPRVGE